MADSSMNATAVVSQRCCHCIAQRIYERPVPAIAYQSKSYGACIQVSENRKAAQDERSSLDSSASGLLTLY